MMLMIYELLIQRPGVADQLKRHGKGWVPWAGSLSTKKRVARPPPWKVFALTEESAGQTNFTRKHDIWYIFDFSLFVHNCIYNSPHLKERQPNIIVLQCDGLIKMVIFTIWYSSHCNILHLRDWVQKVITRHNWTTHTATEIDKKKKRKLRRRPKKKRWIRNTAMPISKRKRTAAPKQRGKNVKHLRLGAGPSGVSSKSIWKCTNAHLTIYTNVREFLRKQEIAPLI